MDRAEAILAWLTSIPDWLLYIVIGIAAALENIVPPIPADVMVIAAGVIVGASAGDPGVLFVVVWLSNVASALFVYAVGWRYGAAFFGGRLGRFLLAPAQVDALALAYRRYGLPIVFFSRFLPVFRPIVPAFAGVARLGAWGTAIPIACASGIWYGLLVYVGSAAGRNYGAVIELLSRVGGWLWVVTALLLLALSLWWWRTRSRAVDPEPRNRP